MNDTRKSKVTRAGAQNRSEERGILTAAERTGRE